MQFCATREKLNSSHVPVDSEMSVVTCTKPGFFSFWFSSHLKRFYSHLTRKTNTEREMFYLTTHSTHFIYGYMASDIWLRTILIVRKETRCHHIGYSYRLTARVLLYAPSHRQGNTYHGLCYTSRGALAGTRIAQWVHPMKDRSDDPLHHERTLYL